MGHLWARGKGGARSEGQGVGGGGSQQGGLEKAGSPSAEPGAASAAAVGGRGSLGGGGKAQGKPMAWGRCSLDNQPLGSCLCQQV